MNLTLAYDGEFGFTAILTIQMDGKNAGFYANLFYYNPESEELEFMCAGMIDEAGNAELTFTHASDYTIIIDREPMNPQEQGIDGMQMQTAQTGNHAWIWVVMAVVLLAAAGLVIVIMVDRHKKNKS